MATIKHDGDVHSASFSPDGQYMLTCSSDKTARIWKKDGSLVATFQHDDSILNASFSPKGDYVATATKEGKVAVWHFGSR